MANNKRDVIIEIETKTHQALADIKRLNGEINSMKKHQSTFAKTTTGVNQMSRSFKSLAVHVGRLAIIYGAFQGLQNTVRTFATFEQSLKRLEVISGVAGDELVALEEKAKFLGESTIFTASQVTDAMNEMAKAGLTSEEILGGIKPVLDLASVGMMGLAEASTIASTTMKGFNLEAQDMSRIADVIVAGATGSNQSISELGEAFSKVAPFSTALGHSFEETTSALMIMADAGRRGADAGTQLKIVMQRLTANQEAEKYISKLGNTYDEVTGKMKPFADQLRVIRDGVASMDEKTRNTNLSLIFGRNGIASAITLLGNLDKFDIKVRDLNNSFGLASKSAKRMQDTLQGSYKALKSALEGLSIRIGSELTPMLRKLTDETTEFIRSLDPDEIKSFSRDIGELILLSGELAKALVGIVGEVAHLARSFRDITGVSAGWVVALGYVGVKLKGLIPILRGLYVAMGPVGWAFLALATGIETGIQGYQKIKNELIDFEKGAKRVALVTNDMAKGIEDYANAVKEGLTETDGIKHLDKMQVKYDTLTGEVEKAKKEIKDLDSMFGNSAQEDMLIKELQNRITQLNGTLDLNAEVQANMTEKIKEARVVRQEYIKTVNAQKSAEHQLAMDAQPMADEQVKAVNKVITANETRSKSLNKQLGAMSVKERKYADQLIALVKEVHNIREAYANKRLGLNQSLEGKIASLRNKGLSDLQVYNNSQERADKLLGQAKNAIAQGNAELAKQYLAEYDTLVAVSAGEEITQKKKVSEYNAKSKKVELKEIDVVVKTRASTLAKGISDLKKSHAIKMQILKLEETKELEVANANIKAKKLDIQLLEKQIKIQKQMIDLVDKFVASNKDIQLKVQFDGFVEESEKVKKTLDELSDQQVDIKIKGELSSLKSDVDNYFDTKQNVEVAVDADMTPATEKKDKWVTTTEGNVITIGADLNTKRAVADRSKFITTTEGNVVTITTKADTSQPDRAIARLKRNTFSSHTVYVKTVNKKQLGGVVTPMPKFNDGGSPLENGKGHSRKTGKMSGYGGGDKIKALIENGEYVVRKEAVRALGLARLDSINQGQLPKYQHGGFVSPIQKFATGGQPSVIKTAPSKTVNLNLNIGNQQFSMVSEESVANALASFLERGEF
jgi:TP901 family phage tail tape measure protein